MPLGEGTRMSHKSKSQILNIFSLKKFMVFMLCTLMFSIIFRRGTFVISLLGTLSTQQVFNK